MPAPVLQFKRGNAGVAGTVPALRPGEPAISLNNFDFFIGSDSLVEDNKFFGSHRYWGREDATNSLRLKLVDKDGTNGIHLKSPNTLSGIGTYTLPDTTTIQNGYYLKVASDGTLSWDSVSANATFSDATLSGITTISGSLDNQANSINSGITTFTDTTNNTLGNENTGAVQIDGGLGIAKNLTVKENLHVGGYSEFVGVVTFRGGTINIGDGDTDDINVGGEFISGLYPNTTATYDLGDGSRQWRHGNFSGVGTFSTGANIDAIQIGISGASEIDTTSGALTLDSSSGQTIIDDDLSITGVATVTGALLANGDVTLGDTSGDTIIIKGTTTFEQTITGTATTATRATLIDTTGTSDDATYYVTFVDTSAGQTSETLRVGTALSVNASTGNFKASGDLIAGSGYLASGNGTRSMYMYDTSGDVSFQGKVIANNFRSSTNANNTLTLNDLDATFARNLIVSGITTVGTSLSAPTVKLSTIVSSDTGSTVLTVSSNNVTTSNDLTVSGNLYVNGSTTQVNTAAITVEDRTIELGVVDGVAPTATTWDLGVLFNYNSSGAKKSAVIWEHQDSRFKFASILDPDTNGNDFDTPQLTVSTYAAIEISSLWINDCSGQSQIITCSGTERFLENITIDAGTF